MRRGAVIDDGWLRAMEALGPDLTVSEWLDIVERETGRRLHPETVRSLRWRHGVKFKADNRNKWHTPGIARKRAT